MSGLDESNVGVDGGLTVDVANRSEVSEVDVERWARVAVETLVAEQVDGGHLDLTFIDADEMAELNRIHMGHDGPTDVLSFPLDADDERMRGDGFQSGLDGDHSDVPPVLLGDVVICPVVAIDQAAEHCGDPETELTLLVVHGVLHILGHDHAEPIDEAVMVERETAHLQRYGLTHPGPVRPAPDRR